MHIHDFDHQIKVPVFSYMCQVKEHTELGPHLTEFLNVINPYMHFKFIEYIYYNEMCNFNVFENCV